LKKAKLSRDETHLSIVDKLRDGLYSSTEHLEADIHSVCGSIIKQVTEKQDSLLSGPSGRTAQLPEEEVKLLAGAIAFEKVAGIFISKFTNAAHPGGISKSAKNATNGDDDAIPLINMSKPGKPVLTLFANAQGPKQLFSSFQKTIRVGECNEADNFDSSVEVSIPLQESALPNFIISTTIPASSVEKRTSKGATFGERYPPSKSIPQIQPPINTNKLLTKASTIGWVSEESLSRSLTRRSYNWSVTKLATGRYLYTSKVHELPGEPASPEERRRQRDRALSTGSAQPPQSEAARLAAQQVKDEALFRSAFSSFAPCYDNSDAIVPTDVKNEIWWSRIGRQRAERVFGGSLDEDGYPDDVDVLSGAEDEEISFEEAIENFDPAILETASPFKTKNEEDQTIDDILQEINELIETLYSYQRIRGSTVSAASAPMTPVGQRTALSEITGTPSTPSVTETEIYKTLKAQLALLICQLPPHVVTRLNGDKLQKLNISTDMIVETEDIPGNLESKSAPAITQQNSILQHRSSVDAVSPFPAVNRGPSRNAPLAPARPGNTYHQQHQMQPRTPSASYPRPSGPQAYTPSYPATASRSQYVAGQPVYQQAGYTPSPMRMNYQQQNPQYYTPQPVANRINYTPAYSGTPQGQPRQYANQGPTQSYPRQAYPASGLGYQTPAPAPQVQTASPMQAPAGTSPHFRNPSSGRTLYYPPATANAIGPTGFHTTLTTQEQQVIMDRQRQIALQNQARSAAMGQATANVPLQPAASNYTTPSRHSSDTPQPVAPQMNGTPK
jgi:hypothetical protein